MDNVYESLARALIGSLSISYNLETIEIESDSDLVFPYLKLQIVGALDDPMFSTAIKKFISALPHDESNNSRIKSVLPYFKHYPDNIYCKLLWPEFAVRMEESVVIDIYFALLDEIIPLIDPDNTVTISSSLREKITKAQKIKYAEILDNYTASHNISGVSYFLDGGFVTLRSAPSDLSVFNDWINVVSHIESNAIREQFRDAFHNTAINNIDVTNMEYVPAAIEADGNYNSVFVCSVLIKALNVVPRSVVARANALISDLMYNPAIMNSNRKLLDAMILPPLKIKVLDNDAETSDICAQLNSNTALAGTGTLLFRNSPIKFSTARQTIVYTNPNYSYVQFHSPNWISAISSSLYMDDPNVVISRDKTAGAVFPVKTLKSADERGDLTVGFLNIGTFDHSGAYKQFFAANTNTCSILTIYNAEALTVKKPRFVFFEQYSSYVPRISGRTETMTVISWAKGMMKENVPIEIDIEHQTFVFCFNSECMFEIEQKDLLWKLVIYTDSPRSISFIKDTKRATHFIPVMSIANSAANLVMFKMQNIGFTNNVISILRGTHVLALLYIREYQNLMFSKINYSPTAISMDTIDNLVLVDTFIENGMYFDQTKPNITLNSVNNVMFNNLSGNTYVARNIRMLFNN